MATTTIIMGSPLLAAFRARKILGDNVIEGHVAALNFNTLTGMYEVKSGEPAARNSDCKNCGAPHEPGMCSYCGTRHG